MRVEAVKGAERGTDQNGGCKGRKASPRKCWSFWTPFGGCNNLVCVKKTTQRELSHLPALQELVMASAFVSVLITCVPPSTPESAQSLAQRGPGPVTAATQVGKQCQPWCPHTRLSVLTGAPSTHPQFTNVAGTSMEYPCQSFTA